MTRLQAASKPQLKSEITKVEKMLKSDKGNLVLHSILSRLIVTLINF